MTTTCPKCGAAMEQGFATATGLVGGAAVEGREPRLLFVVVGESTSPNPIEAFKQGSSGEAGNRVYSLFGVRCSRCGYVELYGSDERDT